MHSALAKGEQGKAGGKGGAGKAVGKGGYRKADKGRGKGGYKSTGEMSRGAEETQKVHYICESRQSVSVPIAETLSRLKVKVNGSWVVISGSRTCFHTLNVKESAEAYLEDGTSFWQVTFMSPSAHRPPKEASARIMQKEDWHGCMLACTTSAEKRAAEEFTNASQPRPSEPAPEPRPSEPAPEYPRKKYPCRYGAECRKKADPIHCEKYTHPDGPFACSTCSTCSGSSPAAILEVEEVESEGEDWVLYTRSLSQKAHAESVDLDHLLPEPPMQKLRRSISPSGRVYGILVEEPTEQLCGICMVNDTSRAPKLCQFNHSCCEECMPRHIEVELRDKGVLPQCPFANQCGHVLTKAQVEDFVDSRDNKDEIMNTFQKLAQDLSLANIPAFQCEGETCEDWIIPSKPGQSQLVACPTCKIRFCSLCKRKPHHFRVSCEEAPAADAAWHEWLGSGRDQYLQRLAAYAATVSDPEIHKLLEQLDSDKAGEVKAEQAKMLAQAEERKREFDEMEAWKAANCKCCPSCSRPIFKVDGCDAMVCGRNYHGGDVQNGCGHSFGWSSAPAYRPTRADHVTATIPKMGADYQGHRMLWEKEPGIFLNCAMCKEMIRGPLFLCIDCLACCACLRCANGMGSAAGGQHRPESHVFSILWNLEELKKADYDILKENNLTSDAEGRRIRRSSGGRSR
jgi:hypothetical protein